MTQEQINEFNIKCAEFMGWQRLTEEEQIDFLCCKDLSKVRPDLIPIFKSEDSIYWIDTLEFHSDWNKLHMVIDKIESLDERHKHYEWYDIDNELRNNFMSYSVDIEQNQCFIWENLELDPATCMGKSRANTKKEAVIDAINQFLDKYNNL